jgi:amino acid adenylation domain-containing protein
MCKQAFDSSVRPDWPLLTEAEQKQLGAWNETAQDYPQDACVPKLVAAQAAARPDAVALVAGCEVVTYGELNSRANRLAHHLRSLGAGPETLVALCLERSPALVVGALGVLKSGAAYVPLDPTYPSERLAFMLNDSQALILLTKQCLAERLPAGSWKVVDLDADARDIAHYPADAPQADPNLGNLAYVIYTSGSTGRPKGVQITHDSLLNLVFWHQRAFAVTHSDRATLQASPGFDASVWELWPYLTAGASVHLPDETIRTDADSLRDWLLAEKIRITFVPTAMAERVMTLPWPRRTPLRVMLTGAETLHHYPSPRLPFVLVNNYGPTECTVVATSGTVPCNEHADGRPSIGWPIANTQIYILDEQLRQVPPGVPGELHIGGKGLARGYLNQPDLTDEKFIRNPFSSRPESRLYKTGDVACYLPDGQIEFMGRMDDQIKIRGYRIEPNEIVTLLNRHPAVQASQVVAREDNPGDRRLVAYVVPVPGFQPTCAGLRDFLRALLPEYMLPAVFVLLESLPLTSNGKVNRDMLPAPNASNILRDEPCAPARTVVEKRIAGILANLLALEQVGVHDNFFLLGGHSLLGTQVIARVRDAFGVELSLRRLFEAPTVAELSAEVERLLFAKVEAMSEEEAQRMLSANPSQGPGFTHPADT